MKTIIAALFILGSSGVFAQNSQKVESNIYTVPLRLVDVVLSDRSGYVAPEELKSQDVSLSGVQTKDDLLIIDLNKPKLDVSAVILNSGTVVDVTAKVEGGDMGGGGRIIQH